MRLRHRDLDPVQAQLGAAAGHIPRHRHLRQRRAVLGDQPLPDPPGRMPLLARQRPGPPAATRRSPPHTGRSPAAAAAGRPSAAAGPRWPAPGAPSAGAHDAGQPAPGSTTRPARWSRLICSNSSTRDRAIPDLRADNNDVKIRTRVGPEFATTRRPPPGAITTQAGPKFATKTGPAGASSGDHTHPLFRGMHGRPLATITYRRAWDRARLAVLSDEEYRSPLARGARTTFAMRASLPGSTGE